MFKLQCSWNSILSTRVSYWQQNHRAMGTFTNFPFQPSRSTGVLGSRSNVTWTQLGQGGVCLNLLGWVPAAALRKLSQLLKCLQFVKEKYTTRVRSSTLSSKLLMVFTVPVVHRTPSWSLSMSPLWSPGLKWPGVSPCRAEDQAPRRAELRAMALTSWAGVGRKRSSPSPGMWMPQGLGQRSQYRVTEDILNSWPKAR
jgi:hypothetical protein